jgi:hypothetical protein
MKHLKPVDKAMFCMVSEFAGRNESERIGSLVTLNQWPSFYVMCEGSIQILYCEIDWYEI